jgi:hypothetical protein
MLTDTRRRRYPRTRLRTGLVIVAAAGAVVASGLQPAAALVVPRAQGVQAQTLRADAAKGGTTCAENGAGQTCSGTFSGNTAYDPTKPTLMSGKTPTVTVDQTQDLTDQMVHVSWTNFTPSYSVNGSTAIDPTNLSLVQYGVAIFQCRSQAPAYEGYYGQVSGSPANDCYPVWDPSQATAGPRNGIITVTHAGTADTSVNQNNQPASCSTAKAGDTECGTGSADFQVETSAENSALGCTDANPCSIVVVPMWGGYDGDLGVLPNPPDDPSPPDYPGDPQGQLGFTYDCSIHDYDSSTNSNDPNAANMGTMAVWGDSCAWANRITVPISFAPTPTGFCGSTGTQFTAEGSPALERAMAQWRPGWCKSASAPVSFDYNSAVNEYLARQDFLRSGAGGLAPTDMALVTDPANSDLTSVSSRKFTYAPIAVTGIAVAYYVDDVKTGQPVTDLKLNARLLAKLLTESYSQQFGKCSGQTAQTQTCDPAVAGNPTNVFDDPEFLALNPQYTPADFNNDLDGNTLPVVVAGNSDLTYELTRWIAADPDALAFLQGRPDPWGMRVNGYFKTGQSYPISQFQSLDPGFSSTIAQALASQPGYNMTMQAAWNPVTGLDDVVSRLAVWQSSAVSYNPVCPSPPCSGVNGYTNPKAAPQLLGARSLFAIVDQGSAAAFRFPTAQLVNPAGNAVAPTAASMSAAVSAMKTNPDKITQYQDYSNTSANAYPLTEVQYAMVPTCGISTGTVAAIDRFLSNAAGSQIYGTDLGQLPPFGGYLTLNPAQKAQISTAEAAVSSQSCTSPPPDTTVSGHTGGGAGGGQSGGSGSSGTGGGSGTGTGVSASSSASAGATGGASASPSSTNANGQQPVGLGTKSGDNGGAAQYVLPVALAAGAALALGGPLAYLFGTGAVSLPYGRRRMAAPGSGSDGVPGDEGSGDGGSDG